VIGANESNTTSGPTLNLVHLNWNVNGISRQKKAEWLLEERHSQVAGGGVVRG
jgi:hypothetical protein